MAENKSGRRTHEDLVAAIKAGGSVMVVREGRKQIVSRVEDLGAGPIIVGEADEPPPKPPKPAAGTGTAGQGSKSPGGDHDKG